MSPALRRETPPDRAASRALRKEVRALLEAGHVVALPTETVYGLAARADDPAALRRLCALKGRDSAAGLTWHVGSTDALASFGEHRALVARLAKRLWPGPLTLVLAGVPAGLEHVARDGWTGVRFPAHPALASLLQFAPFPIVMTSANRGGDPPATDAATVQALFDDDIELLLDSGPTRLAESSAVLRVGPGRFRVLREGLLGIDGLRRTAGLHIGFVCTGNTCRSPMAEVFARDVLARRLARHSQVEDPDPPESFGFRTGSAGVFAGTGSPASEHSVTIAAERGIDLTHHRSRPATPERIRDWDRVYCLTSSHREALTASLPPARAKHVELLDPTGRDIPDPMGGSLADYRECARRIEECLERRVEEWV